jgi:hypothetical protein
VLSSLRQRIGKRSELLFVIAGIAWTALSYISFTYLLLWPAAVCFLSTVFLYVAPYSRFSYSLAKASSIYGVMVSLFQIYYSSQILSSPLFLLGIESIGIFLLLGIFHFIIFISYTQAEKTK